MSERAWLHHGGLVTCATPVDVLSSGPKQARVRLRHALRWNGETLAAGVVRHVPVTALGAKPWPYSMVSVGRCTYVPERSARGRRAVARG